MIVNFGKKLRLLRKEAAISQTELALILGFSPTSKGFISEIESGRKPPSAELVLQVAERFGVTTDYLLRDDIPIERSGNRFDQSSDYEG